MFQCIEKRRSVRSFRDVPIPEEDLIKILKAGIQAPSAGNIQPWRFIVTTKEDLKMKLAEAALGQYWMVEAGVIITVCAVEDESATYYGTRGRSLYCIQDTAAAVENILLASTALGYGSCWVGAFDEMEVRKTLSIPRDVRPVALIPIGAPAETPEARSRKDLRQVVYHETYGKSRL
ncbi:MAG: nitroreductase family protein [Candidatus Methanomethyliaceae archaeon]|nr:nitroreductase family protein [Candidatus Methanomethyliaceae archaeon]